MSGENKSIAQHDSFLAYKSLRYFKLAVLLCAISIAAYFYFDFEPVRNGGTWMGYTLGVVATALIIWLTLLGLRKRIISQGHWSLKAWTSAHVYLGLSLIVIATLHTGFQFGWNIHTLAYALMMFVIISGVFGLYAYISVPKRMSNNRAQMSQAEMLGELENLSRLLRESAQELSDEYTDLIQNSVSKTRLGGNIFTRLSRKTRHCPTRKALDYFNAEMLEVDENKRGPILNVISVLERKNALLGRIRKHIRFKAILQIWLYVHIPITFALLAALSIHIFSVFYYS